MAAKKKHNAMLKKGSSVFIVTVLGTFISVVLNILYAKVLGPSAYGEFSFTISLITILASLSVLGLPSLINKELPIYIEGQEHGKSKGLIYFALLSILLSISVTLLILFLLDIEDLTYITVNIGLVSFVILGFAILKSKGYAIYGTFIYNLLRPLVSLTILIFYIYIYTDKSFEELDLVYSLFVLANLIAFIFVTVSVYVLVRNNYIGVKKVVLKSLWIKNSLPLLVTGSFSVLVDSLPIVLLKGTVNSDSLGLYRIASLGGGVLSFVILSFGAVALPAVAVFMSQRKYAEVANLSVSCVKKSLLLLLPVLIIFYFSDRLIPIFLGSGYDGVYQALLIIMAFRFLMTLLGIPGYILMVSGDAAVVAKVWGVGLAVGMLLGWHLSSMFGFLAMIISVTFSELLVNFILGRILEKKIKFKVGLI